MVASQNLDINLDTYTAVFRWSMHLWCTQYCKRK